VLVARPAEIHLDVISLVCLEDFTGACTKPGVLHPSTYNGNMMPLGGTYVIRFPMEYAH